MSLLVLILRRKQSQYLARASRETSVLPSSSMTRGRGLMSTALPMLPEGNPLSITISSDSQKQARLGCHYLFSQSIRLWDQFYQTQPLSLPLNNYYMSNYSYLFKYIVIGDSSVGKSCLMLQFLQGKFNPDHDATIGVEFGSKIIRSRQKDIKLQIWDTAGQEAYKSITRSYYRGSIGIILAYDITRRKSFENVVKWIEDTKKYANEKISLILVGNKEDLGEKRVVSLEEGRELAEQNNVLFLETSAKTPYNVNELFQNLTDRLVDRIESKELDDKDEMCGIKKGLIERQRLLDSQRTVKKGWCW